MSTSLKIILISFALSACGGALTPVNMSSTNTAATSSVAGGNEPAARLVFHESNFSKIADFIVPQNTAYQCLGDVINTFRVDSEDYSGAPTLFPYASGVDSLSPTTRPAFIKNISVDMTNTYFAQTVENVSASDRCSYRSTAALPSSCADFDNPLPPAPTPTVAPTATPSPSPIPISTPTTSEYYNTGFYRVRDDWCTNQGPIRNYDTETSKAYVGGVSIDLDRAYLGK